MRGNHLSYSWNESQPEVVARTFAWGVRLLGPEEFDNALQPCRLHPLPFLLDDQVTQHKSCYLTIRVGCGHHEVMLADDVWYKPAA